MERYKRIFKEKVDIKTIDNFKELPKETQKFMAKELDKFSSIGHKELEEELEVKQLCRCKDIGLMMVIL